MLELYVVFPIVNIHNEHGYTNSLHVDFIDYGRRGNFLALTVMFFSDQNPRV
jgi:hypothetical protein